MIQYWLCLSAISIKGINETICMKSVSIESVVCTFIAEVLKVNLN